MKVVQKSVSRLRDKTCQTIRWFRSSYSNVYLNLVKTKLENWKPQQSSLKIPVTEFCLRDVEDFHPHPWP